MTGVTTSEITRVNAAALREAPEPRRLPPWAWVLIGTAVVWTVGFLIFRSQLTDTLATAATTPLQDALYSVKQWVADNRDSNPVLLFLDGVRVVVDAVTQALLSILAETTYGRGYPEVGWFGSTLLFAYIAWVAGNARVAILTAVCFTFIGLQGLYVPAMQTLAITLTAVMFALVVGIPLGIWMGRSKTVARILTPVLDFMQTMPTFVYLAPLALIFLIGPASAVITTVIYAAPPVIRLTAHGVRDIPANIDEAVASLGATPRQRLRGVVLPLARSSIVLGINQTTMAALSMVTIAALIAAPGLGQLVVQALQSLNVGAAFNAGLAVVLLAIVLDRVTSAIGQRADPVVAAMRRQQNPRARRIGYAVGAVIVIVAIYLSRNQLWAALFPEVYDLGGLIEQSVTAAATWVTTTFSVATLGLQQAFTAIFINPLQSLLVDSPIPLVCAVFVVVALIGGGSRLAIGVAAGLAGVLLLGVWTASMVTLASTLVATVLVMVISIVLGVWMGRSRRADQAVRPILDAAQTMPAFVYLVPFLGLFGASRFTAIVAAIIYAAPIAIKIIADAIERIPAETQEVALSTGSSTWQAISKIQLPLITDAIALAVNQSIIYVLSMVVIGGLVGGGGLGYLVVAGFSQSSLFGKGLAAGLAIVIWGIMLDRITRAYANRQSRLEQAAPGRSRRRLKSA